MNSFFETFRKILQTEASRGYDNKAMFGGLHKFIPALENNSKKLNIDPALVSDMMARLTGYASLDISQRPAAIESILQLISAATTAAPPPVAPPEDRAREEAEREKAREKDKERERERDRQRQREKEREQERAKRPPTTATGREDPQPAATVPPPTTPPKPAPVRAAASPTPAKRRPLPPEPPGIGLDAPMTVVRGIGGKNGSNLERLGLSTLGDALLFFPRRHVDYSHLKTINRLEIGEEVTIIATIWESYLQSIRGGRDSILKCVLSDGTGTIEASWFNMPWLKDKLTPTMQVQISGKVDQYLGRLVLRQPEWEYLDAESIRTGRIVPVYSLTKGISAHNMRRWMYEAVGYAAPRAIDVLPPAMRRRLDLLPYAEALLQMHFPDTADLLAAARKRLAFEEMLLLQLGVRKQRMAYKSETGKPAVVADAELDRLVAVLPYALTGAQQRALADLRADIARAVPMNRLLQGDVGSGKTIVAALAMAIAVGTQSAAGQTALMAPTAILAEQHYRTISALFEKFNPSARVALLLGSTPEAEKQEIYAALRDGAVHAVIGTHALIQEGVEFANLMLAVVDEQHRFGVSQRAVLRGKGGKPHLLVMTATPIPRTLALTLYGDLDVTILDEMPPGRQPIETRVLGIGERERAYTFIRSQIEQGRQAYIICPLVEESEKVEAKAAVDEYARLQEQVFPDLRLGLLHGRMKPDEKDEVMSRFRAGDFSVLVSTSVVEVGVDVPNAAIMLVEGANRFGLSQLHQFRGRVGRGEFKSYCLLVAESNGSKAADEIDPRLAAMEQSQDGFVLAEKDLELRGPGEFLGTRQAGFGDLRLARLTDLVLIDLARREADALLADDPALQKEEHAALAAKLAEFWRNLAGAGDVS